MLPFSSPTARLTLAYRHFVPNITMGAPILTCVKKGVPDIFMDCHMMVADPIKVRASRPSYCGNGPTPASWSQWVPAVAEAGGKLYTFHLEAVCESLFHHCRYTADADSRLSSPRSPRRSLFTSSRCSCPADPLPVIAAIHQHSMLAGLAISPQTPASAITPEAYAAADMILVMTVHPGKGGQKFMPECLEKVKELRERFGWDKDVQVDGGVGPGNICQCAQAGTSSLSLHFPFRIMYSRLASQDQTSSSPVHPSSQQTSRQT